MNVLYFTTEEGNLVGKAPVTFGGMNSTQSEQSVVVNGYEAVVVNNWFDDDKVHEICKPLKAVINHFGFSDKMA